MSDHHVFQKKAWLVCMTAALFFFYEFIQMNLFNAISAPLMQDFQINATGLGRLSSFYFIANVVFLFPAGILLDRYSTRRVILTALMVCIVGTVLFSTAQTITSATIYRFMTGIGSAFCFLSVIRLATRWFPATHLAMITGVVVTIAMCGGMLAQTPLTWLLSVVSWRQALWIDGVLGGFIFIAIALVVRDYPPEFAQQHKDEQKTINQMGYWRSLRYAFFSLQNWLGGIYTSLMNLMLVILGGLWGVLYLTTSFSLTMAQATDVTMMLFLGTVIGSPLVGYWSDRICLRRQPMMIGALLSFIFVMTLLYSTDLSFYALIFLFLGLGISTSAQIIGYPTVAENSIPAITAMSVSVVNITTQGGGAIFEQLFGRLMDRHAQFISQSLQGHYIPSDFTWGLWIFPIGFAIAFLAAFTIKETYGKPRKA